MAGTIGASFCVHVALHQYVHAQSVPSHASSPFLSPSQQYSSLVVHASVSYQSFSQYHSYFHFHTFVSFGHFKLHDFNVHTLHNHDVLVVILAVGKLLLYSVDIVPHSGFDKSSNLHEGLHFFPLSFHHS
jgi:hypothetical protein